MKLNQNRERFYEQGENERADWLIEYLLVEKNVFINTQLTNL
jgi:hypothetical protein